MKGITWPDYEGPEVYFPGVPGVYGKGTVVPLADLGRDEAEVRALIEGSPLKIVDLKEAKKPKDGDSQ